jgi:hypothetical protein
LLNWFSADALTKMTSARETCDLQIRCRCKSAEGVATGECYGRFCILCTRGKPVPNLEEGDSRAPQCRERVSCRTVVPAVGAGIPIRNVFRFTQHRRKVLAEFVAEARGAAIPVGLQCSPCTIIRKRNFHFRFLPNRRGTAFRLTVPNEFALNGNLNGHAT